MKKVTLTREMIEAGMSDNGGFSNKQVARLGVKVKNNSGWLKQLIGREVRVEQYEAFMDLKNAHLEKKRSYNAKRYVFKDQKSCPFFHYIDADAWCTLSKKECDLDTCPLKKHGRIIVDWKE